MPSIYVGTYGKYNSGSIFGAWLNMDDYTDQEDFENACQELHKGEHDPEFMFQDYEGFPEGMISEYGLDPEFWDWHLLQDYEKEMVEAFYECVGDKEADFSYIEECFCGTWNDFSDYVYESFTDCNQIPDHLSNYIDWEKVERDWEMDHYYSDNSGGCHVFRA
jgi:antirestriction protein